MDRSPSNTVSRAGTTKTVALLTTRPERPGFRFRLEQFTPSWEAASWNCRTVVLPKSIFARLALFRSLRTVDVVVVQQRLFASLELAWLRSCAKRLIYDVDDAVIYKANGQLDARHLRRFRSMVRSADATVCGNPWLTEFTAQHGGRATLIPTVVDSDRFRPREVAATDGPLVVGWTGSSPTNPHLNTLLPVLRQFSPRELSLRFVSDSTDGVDLPSLGDVTYEFIRWTPAIEASVVSSFDIGVMPLPDNAFTRGKCGCKALQYMAAGVPVIASPIGVNSKILTEGVTGLLAETPDDWEQAIRRLIDDAKLRQQLGQAGRDRAVEHYSVTAWANRWLELLNDSRTARVA